MSTVPIKGSDGNTYNVESMSAVGRVAAASSRPVVLSNEDLAALTQLHTDLIAATPAGTALIGKVGIDQTTPGTTNRTSPGVFNGTSYDPFRKPSGFFRIASSSTGGNIQNVKATAGDLFQMIGANAGTITYVQIYNKATTPIIGTDTPVITYPLAINQTLNLSFGTLGAYFSNGIGFAFTTDSAGTTAAAAAAVLGFTVLYA